MITDTDPTPQQCEECSEILHGRTDKRFCSDLCRTSFNNRKRQKEAAVEPAFLREIPKIILQNYRILSRFHSGKTTTIRKALLDKHGFNYKFITSYYKTLDGDVYHFCFDLGYLHIKGDRVLIVNQQSQVEA